MMDSKLIEEMRKIMRATGEYCQASADPDSMVSKQTGMSKNEIVKMFELAEHNPCMRACLEEAIAYYRLCS